MDYREYIDSVSPTDELKDKTLDRLHKTNSKRLKLRPLAAAAAIVLIAVGVYGLAPHTEDEVKYATTTQQVPYIETYTQSGDTVKSIPQTLIIDGSSYFEDRGNSAKITPADITFIGKVDTDNFEYIEDAEGSIFLNAEIYEINNDTHILIKSGNQYHLFKKITRH